MNIIGVVILYQPDTSILFDHINSYLPALDKLLLFDNSEIYSSELEQLIQDQNSAKLLYRFYNENAGIAKRLNQAADYAIENGYDYLLMMDQDSGFKDNDQDVKHGKNDETTVTNHIFICNFGSKSNFLKLIQSVRWVTPNWVKQRIHESGNDYHLELGQKHLESFIYYTTVGSWGGDKKDAKIVKVIKKGEPFKPLY